MKLRSKLLLSATCLLTISVAATATSAYAWFVSNRQAELKLIGAEVKTNATNLYIAGTGTSLSNGNTVGFATYLENPKQTSIGPATAESVVATDISGDGKAFFKPNLAPDFTNAQDNLKASSIVSVENDKPAGKNYYHQFELTFTQSNVNVTTGVYLSCGSTIKPTLENDDSKIEEAVRVAFLDTSNNLLLYWAPYEDSSTLPATYLKAASTSPVKMGDKEDKSGAVGDIVDITKAKYLDSAFNKDIDDASESKVHNSKLLELTDGSTQTVRVRVWFEGMDSNCVTGITSSTINVNLKFNGVNMGI